MEQKIFEAELLVDYLLLGEDWVNATLALTNAYQTGKGLQRDINQIAAWREKRRKEREAKKRQQQKQVVGDTKPPMI
jgi:hypothetical protein